MALPYFPIDQLPAAVRPHVDGVAWIHFADSLGGATGTLVGGEWMLTAGHAMPTPKVAATRMATFGFVYGGQPASRDTYALDCDAGFHAQDGGPNGMDFALVRVRPHIGKPALPGVRRSALVASDSTIGQIKPGDELFMVHHPDSHRYAVFSRGRVQAVQGSSIFHSVAAEHGTSGATLLNAQGLVIGIHTHEAKDSNDPLVSGRAVSMIAVRQVLAAANGPTL